MGVTKSLGAVCVGSLLGLLGLTIDTSDVLELTNPHSIDDLVPVERFERGVERGHYHGPVEIGSKLYGVWYDDSDDILLNDLGAGYAVCSPEHRDKVPASERFDVSFSNGADTIRGFVPDDATPVVVYDVDAGEIHFDKDRDGDVDVTVSEDRLYDDVNIYDLGPGDRLDGSGLDDHVPDCY